MTADGAMSGTTEYAAFDSSAVAPVVAKHVAVIAPADLPGGYELHCDFQGRPMVVRVVRLVYGCYKCARFNVVPLPLHSNLYL